MINRTFSPKNIMNKMYWIFFLCFHFTIQAQEEKILKETIGWETYAFHMTGDIYKVKNICTYDENGQCLFCVEKYNNNIDTTLIYQYDDKKRLIYRCYFHYTGAIESEDWYEYPQNANYYIKKTRGGETSFTYYYLDNEQRIIEEKECERDYETQDCILEKWVIYTYNKSGLLIGKRYKKAEANELSKELYRYKKGTTILETIERYYWDKDRKNEVFKKDASCDYEYDKDGRLTKMHDKGSGYAGGFHINTYQYKNGKLWIKRHKDGHQTLEWIYKNGLLVVVREYWKNSGRDVNDVEDLMSEEYYEYKYYDY